MATIRKRSGAYQFRCSVGYDCTGKQIVRTKTWRPPPGWSEKKADREAQDQAAIWEKQVLQGEIGSGKIKFSTFAAKWLSDYAEANLRPRTVARYRELLKRIEPAIGHLALEAIRPDHLLAFYKALSTEKKRSSSYISTIGLKGQIKDKGYTQTAFGRAFDISQTTLFVAAKGQAISRRSAEKISQGLGAALDEIFRPENVHTELSGTTIQHYHRLISSILSAAVEWQYIPYNPCSRVAPPKKEPASISYLDDLQAQRFLRLLSQEPGYYRRAAALLLLTGLRRGELLGLEWQDVHWETQTLRISRTAQYLPGRGVYTDFTKNTSSQRVILFSREARAVLLEQYFWQQSQAQQLGAAWQGSGRVITTPEGAVMSPDRLTHWFEKFIRTTDLPPIHLHSLRHTYATLCIAQGVPLTAVAAQLGHATVATTATIYAHAIQSAQLAAADKIGGLFSQMIPANE